MTNVSCGSQNFLFLFKVGSKELNDAVGPNWGSKGWQEKCEKGFCLPDIPILPFKISAPPPPLPGKGPFSLYRQGNQLLLQSTLLSNVNLFIYLFGKSQKTVNIKSFGHLLISYEIILILPHENKMHNFLLLLIILIEFSNNYCFLIKHTCVIVCLFSKATQGNYATQESSGMCHLMPGWHLPEWREEDEWAFVHCGISGLNDAITSDWVWHGVSFPKCHPSLYSDFL